MTDKIKEKQIKVFGFGLPVLLAFLVWRHTVNHQWDALSIALTIAAGVMLVIAIFFRSVLEFIFKYWMKGAHVISMAVTTLILTSLYYGLFTPVAFFLRIAGKDFMQRKRDGATASYWIRREIIVKDNKQQF